MSTSKIKKAVEQKLLTGASLPQMNVQMKLYDYPQGYTKDNCFIVGAFMNYIGDYYAIPNGAYALICTDSGIEGVIGASTYLNMPVRILLQKL